MPTEHDTVGKTDNRAVAIKADTQQDGTKLPPKCCGQYMVYRTILGEFGGGTGWYCPTCKSHRW